MEDLYQEEIINHYQNPQNQGRPKNFSQSFKLTNPLCGDEITVYLTVTDKILKAINYEAQGCAISIATASILSAALKNHTTNSIKQMTTEQLLAIIKIKPTPTRLKCALLPLEAIQKAIDEKR
jgi:nitrogen fixation NifU-like protein